MFGLSSHGFYTLLLIAFVLLSIAFVRVHMAHRRKNRFKVGERIYVDPRKPKVATSNPRWVCPQCFLITEEPGACPNEEHEHTPVQLQPADPTKLEYYYEMQRLTGNVED